MASVSGFIRGNGSSCADSWISLKGKKNGNDRRRDRVKVCCVSSSVMDPYKTLRIQPDASESEVRKAFRQLALQYHPDVCRGSNCGVQFHRINEAYDIVMDNIRGSSDVLDMYETYETYDQGIDEPLRGMNDPDWELWEEWMGWEGAGIRDYSSHVNPYI
ncbi:DnaJ domain-containing protein [Cephalotus follicularis]|uniref:DnaJ domain-containing protein n=1 Tax=Cephalotus follicularis TaxID=3775 RepID=A0A1Q3BU16_CEPFO|nr:DnaJ domain-containing protein [Cephalotus follicularis]